MTTAYETLILAESSLVGFWLLNETGGGTFADSKGSNPLAYQSGLTLGQPGVPGGGTCPLFPGNTSTGYAGTTGNPTGLPTGGSAFSMELWFNTTFGNATSFTGFMGYGTYSGNGANNFFSRSDNVSYGASDWNQNLQVTRGSTLDDGIWHHLVVTYNGSGTRILYLDGVQTGTDSPSPAIVNANPLYVGKGDTTGNGAWHGYLAYPAIYNAALTAAQVANHYTAGAFSYPVDGAASVSFFGGSSHSITLTTSQPNDVIMLVVYTERPSTGTLITVSSISGGGLVWAKRASQTDANANRFNLETWWAVAASPLSLASITVNFSGTLPDNGTITAFGIQGRNVLSPFDPNGSLPAGADGQAQGHPPSVTISTTNPDDVLLAVYGNVSNTDYKLLPTGYTFIAGSDSGASGTLFSSNAGSYKLVSATQTGITVTWGGSANSGLMIVDALTADVPVTGNAPFLLAHF